MRVYLVTVLGQDMHRVAVSGIDHHQVYHVSPRGQFAGQGPTMNIFHLLSLMP